ncbi:MAG: TusE/DsrC/DsvC family sulfur relay protein [Desulfopila sp.]
MHDSRYTVEVNGKQYAVTGDDRLLDLEAWDTDILNWMAAKADITLQEEHLAALAYIRDTYKQRERQPVVRLVADHLARTFGPEKGTPKFFYTLFPKGVAQASALAGIPVNELCF